MRGWPVPVAILRDARKSALLRMRVLCDAIPWRGLLRKPHGEEARRRLEPWLRCLRSAPRIAVKPAIDSGAVAFEADRAARLVALPDIAQRRQLIAFQRRVLAGGAEDHPDIVAAGAIDRIPHSAYR